MLFEIIFGPDTYFKYTAYEKMQKMYSVKTFYWVVLFITFPSCGGHILI
jgi:hypothetical protein